MGDHYHGEAADFGEPPKGIKAIAALARRFGLTVTSGKRTPQMRAKGKAFPRSDHYAHHDPVPLVPVDPEKVRNSSDEALLFYLHGCWDTCPHRTPPGVVCPWCD